MPSTTVHIPDHLLVKIDQIVKEQSISRNRFIIHACERALNSYAGRWPKGFFEFPHNEEDLKLLEEGAAEMQRAVISTRKSRSHVDL